MAGASTHSQGSALADQVQTMASYLTRKAQAFAEADGQGAGDILGVSTSICRRQISNCSSHRMLQFIHTRLAQYGGQLQAGAVGDVTPVPTPTPDTSRGGGAGGGLGWRGQPGLP